MFEREMNFFIRIGSKIFKSEFHLYLLICISMFACSFLSLFTSVALVLLFFNLLQNLVIKISWCNITWSWHEKILLDLSLSENDLHLTIISLDRLLIVVKSIIIPYWYVFNLVKYFFFFLNSIFIFHF